jgi:hypothetical protein
MAAGYIPYSASTPRQAELRSLIRQLKEVRERLTTVRSQMVQTIDGSDYTAMESEYGIAAGKGDEAFAELDSCLAKLNSDASQTNILAAIDQLVAKMG